METPMDPNPDSITTRKEFQAQVRALLAEAEQQGAKELWWVDPDFADWPLNERELVAALSAWAAPQRRLTMLAQRFDEVQRSHPRFVTWRRDFGHVIHCRQVDVDASEVPSLLLVGSASGPASGSANGPTTGLQLTNRQRFRGRRLRDEADVQAWREVIDALMQRSQDGFASTTLGI
jgi:hypothetical protein